MHGYTFGLRYDINLLLRFELNGYSKMHDTEYTMVCKMQSTWFEHEYTYVVQNSAQCSAGTYAWMI